MCTLLSMISARGRVLASNSDNPYVAATRVIAETSGETAWIGSEVLTPDSREPLPWSRMLTRAVNLHGVGFTYSYVEHAAEDEGRTESQLTRSIISDTRSAEQCAEQLVYHAQKLVNGNYLVADRDALFGVAVRAGESVSRQLPEAQFACTNTWFVDEFETAPSWSETTFSNERRSEALSGLRDVLVGDESDVSGLRRILSSDGQGHDESSVEVHGEDRGTISSEIILPGDGIFCWCYGFPSGRAKGFESVTRESWGTYLPFSLDRLDGSGVLATSSGMVTPLGVRALDLNHKLEC